MALGELYDRYGRVVFGMVYAMLGSPEAAEEVVQDAFERVWREARSYRSERGAVRTWLLAIARNAAIDRHRRMAPRTAPERLLDEAIERADPDSDAIIDRAVLSDRVRQLGTVKGHARLALAKLRTALADAAAS